MDVISQLNSLILNSNVKDYIDLVYSIDRDKESPFLSYFAFNYEGDKISNFKVYFEFHCKLKEKDVAKLLPDTGLFFKEYDKLRIGKEYVKEHTGVTFALKITPDNKITRYFHYRLPGEVRVLPKRVELSEEEINKLNNTISYEYDESAILTKNYYIIWNKKTINDLLLKFELPTLRSFKTLDYIEYTETEKYDKIILGISGESEQKEYMDQLPKNHVSDVIERICKEYNLKTSTSSLYNDLRKRSVYFALQSDKLFSKVDTISALRETLFKSGLIKK